jgi:hypothetical protein
MESIFFEFIFFVAIKKRLEEALFMPDKKINSGKILERKAGSGSKKTSIPLSLKIEILIFRHKKTAEFLQQLLSIFFILCSIL